MPWQLVKGSNNYLPVYVNPCPGYPLGRILFITEDIKVEVPENEVEAFLYDSIKKSKHFDTNQLIDYFTHKGVIEYPLEEFV